MGRLHRHVWLKRQGDAEVDDVWLEAIRRLLDPECRAELRAAGGKSCLGSAGGATGGWTMPRR